MFYNVMLHWKQLLTIILHLIEEWPWHGDLSKGQIIVKNRWVFVVCSCITAKGSHMTIEREFSLVGIWRCKLTPEKYERVIFTSVAKENNFRLFKCNGRVSVLTLKIDKSCVPWHEDKMWIHLTIKCKAVACFCYMIHILLYEETSKLMNYCLVMVI